MEASLRHTENRDSLWFCLRYPINLFRQSSIFFGIVSHFQYDVATYALTCACNGCVGSATTRGIRTSRYIKTSWTLLLFIARASGGVALLAPPIYSAAFGTFFSHSVWARCLRIRGSWWWYRKPWRRYREWNNWRIWIFIATAMISQIFVGWMRAIVLGKIMRSIVRLYSQRRCFTN